MSKESFHFKLAVGMRLTCLKVRWSAGSSRTTSGSCGMLTSAPSRAHTLKSYSSRLANLQRILIPSHSPESDTARQSPCTPQRRSCFDFSHESSGPGRIGRVKRKAVQTAEDANLARALQKELSHAGPHSTKCRCSLVVYDSQLWQYV